MRDRNPVLIFFVVALVVFAALFVYRVTLAPESDPAPENTAVPSASQVV